MALIYLNNTREYSINLKKTSIGVKNKLEK